MKILILSQAEASARRIEESISVAMPLAVTSIQMLPEQLPELLNFPSDAIIFYVQDDNIQSVLRAAPADSVLVVGENPSTEARVHAVRMGAIEYLSFNELNSGLLSRTAHFASENRVLRQRSEALAARVEYLSNYDPLTGAYNRGKFFSDISDLVEEACVEEESLGLFLIKLDGFRQVNDDIGQQAGDAVLKVLAHRLEHVLRDSDRHYRIDGSQFAVVLRQADDERGLELAAKRILTALHRPLSVYAQEIVCKISIGGARWPHNAECTDKLMSVADAALNVARHEGGGYRLVDASMLPADLNTHPDTSLIQH